MATKAKAQQKSAVITSKVSSSFIKNASYNPEKKELELSFKKKGSSPVKYFGISTQVWRNFNNASSKGTYFNSRIKGRYAEKVID